MWKSFRIFTSDSIRPGAYWCLIIATLCVQVILIWSTRYLPLIDNPTNLANAYILHANGLVSVLHGSYKIQLLPIPNLGFYLIVTPLLSIVPAEVAMKIFVSIILVLFGVGCHALGRAIHKQCLWSVLVCTWFSISVPLFWGFVNYLLGVALFMLTLSAWLNWRDRWSIFRSLAVIGLGISCYLSHLSSWVFLAIALIVWSWSDFHKGMPILKIVTSAALPLVPPALLFFIFMRRSGSTGKISYGSLYEKLAGLFSPIADYQHTHLLILIALFASSGILFFRSMIYVKFQMEPLMIGLIFALAYWLCPSVLFTSWAADLRFVIPAGVLLLLCVESQFRPGRATVAISLILFVFLLRMVSIHYSWTRLSAKSERALQTLDLLPEQSRLLVLKGKTSDISWQEAAFFEALPVWAVLTRNADVSSHRPQFEQHPVARVDSSYYVPLQDTTTPAAVNWAKVSSYDFIWSYRTDAKFRRELDWRYVLVYQDEDVRLYRIH